VGFLLSTFHVVHHSMIPGSCALALDRKKLAAFLTAACRFLQFPIADRRCNRTRASASKRPVTRAQALQTRANSSGVALASPQAAYRALLEKGLAAARRLIQYSRAADRESGVPGELALDRKKLAALLAAACRFRQFPIGDRRCNRTRASASKRPVTRAQALQTRANSSGVALASPQAAYRALLEKGLAAAGRLNQYSRA